MEENWASDLAGKQNRCNSLMDNKKTGLHLSADNLHVSRGQRERTFTDTSQERYSNANEYIKISRDDPHRISQLRVFEIMPAISCQSFPFAPTRKDGESRASNDDVERGIPASERGFVAPDGGYGWVIVAASFVATFTLGFTFSGFSVLYVDIAEHFESTKGATGFIGSLFFCTGNFLGFLYSPLIQRYGCRLPCMVAACVTVAGFILSSFATSVEFLCVTYGVISGLGTGLIFLTSIVSVQMYFNKKRALAHGIASCGLSCGGLSGAPLLRLWLDKYGLHGTFLLIAGVYMHNIAVGALHRPLPSKTTQRRLIDVSKDGAEEVISEASCRKDGVGDDAKLTSYPEDDVITDAKVSKYPENVTADDTHVTSLSPTREGKDEVSDSGSSASREKEGTCDSATRFLKEAFDVELVKDVKGSMMFLATVLIQFALVTLFSQSYGRAVYIGIRPKLAALLVTIVGTGTLAGRLVCSFLGMKTNRRILLYAGSILAMSSALIAITLTTTFVTMSFVAVACAASAGFVLTLQTPVLVELFGVERIARSQAFHNMAIGLGLLGAVPLGGWLFDISQGFLLPFLVCGAIGLLSGGIVVVMVLLNCKKKFSSSVALEAEGYVER